MPPVLLARVTCPSCNNQFQAPVEQVLDTRADPSAKTRVLNGLVNVIACPHCGTRGALNLPFFYHDPDKELALVYMPMEAGQGDLERQQTIGRFTNAVMDDLPPEERKAYLLQPQVFLTQENLVNRILQADGITPEMIEEQKAKAALLQRMVEASSDEALEAIIKENDAAIDAGLFRLLTINLEMAETMGNKAGVEHLLAVRDKLMASSSEGRAALTRREMLAALRAEPTCEKLLDLLIQAPDEEARRMLITFSQPLVDYRFFQLLTSRIEGASDESEAKRLDELRQEILSVRDQLAEEAKMALEARASLLRDLLLSDDPERLARRRFWELDEIFLAVLRKNIQEAQAAGTEELLHRLQAIQELTVRLADEATPPELRFLNRVMSAETDQEIDQVLQENQQMLTDRLLEDLERVEANVREEGDAEVADRIALVLERARATQAG